MPDEPPEVPEDPPDVPDEPPEVPEDPPEVPDEPPLEELLEPPELLLLDSPPGGQPVAMNTAESRAKPARGEATRM